MSTFRKILTSSLFVFYSTVILGQLNEPSIGDFYYLVVDRNFQEFDFINKALMFSPAAVGSPVGTVGTPIIVHALENYNFRIVDEFTDAAGTEYWVISFPLFKSSANQALFNNRPTTVAGVSNSLTKYFVIDKSVARDPSRVKEYTPASKTPFVKVGVATLPVKIRRKPSEIEFNTEINIAINLAWRWSKLDERNTWGIIGSIGPSNVKVYPNTTGGMVQSESIRRATSFSFGGTFQFRQVNMLIVAGKDFFPKREEFNWQYNDDLWFGLGFGFVFTATDPDPDPKN